MKTNQDLKSALSLGERVSRCGVFTSRSVTGEGSLPSYQLSAFSFRLPLRPVQKVKERTRNVYEKKGKAICRLSPEVAKQRLRRGIRTAPSPVVLRLVKAQEADTLSPWERAESRA
jgi:hypothetical protein